MTALKNLSILMVSTSDSSYWKGEYDVLFSETSPAFPETVCGDTVLLFRTVGAEMHTH